MLRPLDFRERDPVLLVQEATWAPGPVWMGAENCRQIQIKKYIQFSVIMGME